MCCKDLDLVVLRHLFSPHLFSKINLFGYRGGRSLLSVLVRSEPSTVDPLNRSRQAEDAVIY